MIRVLVVDDHPVTRSGLRALLGAAGDIEVVGTADGAAEALTLEQATSPDVVLMDINMPDVDGVAATRALVARGLHGVVLVLTTFSEDARIQAAIDAGAVGYLLKDLDPDELLAGVRAAAAGTEAIAPRETPPLPASGPSPLEILSPREREVLALVSQSVNNREIGVRLGITERTVKAHLRHIFDVLQVASRTEAAVWAREQGLELP